MKNVGGRLIRTGVRTRSQPPSGLSAVGAQGNGDIYVVNADGSGVRKLTDTHQNERLRAWSPKPWQPASRCGPARGPRLRLCRLRVPSFVDDESPEAADRAGRSKVVEVEGQDRKSHPLGKRHHACIDQTEIEIGETCVDLDGAAQSSCGEEGDRVLAGDHGVQEQPCAGGADARTKKLVNLDQNGFRNEQLAAKLSDERRGEAVRSVAAVGRGDERARVRNDSQRTATRSRR
jgi:hypothetical protein